MRPRSTLRHTKTGRLRDRSRKARISAEVALPNRVFSRDRHSSITRPGSAVKSQTKFGGHAELASGAPAAAMTCDRRPLTMAESAADHPLTKREVGVLQRTRESWAEKPRFS